MAAGIETTSIALGILGSSLLPTAFAEANGISVGAPRLFEFIGFGIIIPAGGAGGRDGGRENGSGVDLLGLVDI